MSFQVMGVCSVCFPLRPLLFFFISYLNIIGPVRNPYRSCFYLRSAFSVCLPVKSRKLCSCKRVIAIFVFMLSLGNLTLNFRAIH